MLLLFPMGFTNETQGYLESPVVFQWVLLIQFVLYNRHVGEIPYGFGWFFFALHGWLMT